MMAKSSKNSPSSYNVCLIFSFLLLKVPKAFSKGGFHGGGHIRLHGRSRGGSQSTSYQYFNFSVLILCILFLYIYPKWRYKKALKKAKENFETSILTNTITTTRYENNHHDNDKTMIEEGIKNYQFQHKEDEKEPLPKDGKYTYKYKEDGKILSGEINFVFTRKAKNTNNENSFSIDATSPSLSSSSFWNIQGYGSDADGKFKITQGKLSKHFMYYEEYEKTSERYVLNTGVYIFENARISKAKWISSNGKYGEIYSFCHESSCCNNKNNKQEKDEEEVNIVVPTAGVCDKKEEIPHFTLLSEHANVVKAC